MIAFKTWLQAPENTDLIPTEWPWIQESIGNDQMEGKLLEGYQVLSEEAFQAYLDAHDEDYNAWIATQAEKIAAAQRRKDYQARIDFGVDLLLRFKEKNISEGINWMQAIHLHSRIKDWVVTYPTAAQFPFSSYQPAAPYFQGRTKVVDLINILTVSGDVETACFAIMFGQNDDLSLPEHWVTESRRLWLVSEIKKWLGWT